jgi:Glycosyl transferase family 2
MSGAAIDFLIPVYNAEETLEASLRSVAEQTFSDFRALVVDDGSTDRSPQMLDAFSRADPRFCIIHQENAGIVAALNTALALANAPLIARMDADDLCDPDRLTRQVAYMQQHPDCVAVGGNVRHIDQHDAPIAGLPHPGNPATADMVWVPAREPYIVHPFLMARTDAIRSAGGYRAMPHSEDSDLYWRLAEIGRLHNLPDVLGQYRFHLASISGSSVLNGRIMAVGSQLGALCAQRRTAQRLEPTLTTLTIPALRTAGSLARMLALVEPNLDRDEVAPFRLRVAFKLLELANYRPYELDEEDCHFVADALKQDCAVSAKNALEMRWYLSQASARMLKAGQIRKATVLSPMALWPRALFKAIWR